MITRLRCIYVNVVQDALEDEAGAVIQLSVVVDRVAWLYFHEVNLFSSQRLHPREM